MNDRDVIKYALGYLGAPYVWKGKGLELWDVAGPKSHHWGFPVFDCSGFVTTAYREAGGKDLRFTHAAQTMFDEFPHRSADASDFGLLKLYGASPANVTHVGLSLGNGLVLEAAGGDATTTSPSLAKARGACVRVVFDTRRDFLGWRAWPR
jgi:cell wall-associated NlpC family hydrolase